LTLFRINILRLSQRNGKVNFPNIRSSPKFGSKLRIRFEDGIPGVSPLKFIPKIVVF
jgi:hypothetical protein